MDVERVGLSILSTKKQINFFRLFFKKKEDQMKKGVFSLFSFFV
jgi:hypothetical protein